MLLASSCSSSDDADEVTDSTASSSTTSTTADVEPTETEETEPEQDTGPVAEQVDGTATDVIELRPLSASGDSRIVDDLDREVLLRGANVNSLGEYWQGDPTAPSSPPIRPDDWEQMASRGFSVIRLVISWSRVMPERGVVDESYLDEIEAAVDGAAAAGIYTVIDMHQDAYSAFIVTTDENECEGDSRPGKGWDGAPDWATLTDGLSTCVTGEGLVSRSSAPAVQAAWWNFYQNTDGIRTEFANSWKAISARFAGRPEVAGYNLINEPEVPRPAAEVTPLYEALVIETTAAIREAETEAGWNHLIIVEPALPAADPSFGVVTAEIEAIDDGAGNFVFGPHNYQVDATPELPLSHEDLNGVFAVGAASAKVPLWIGEYGYYAEDDQTDEYLRRVAADQDNRAIGAAWWKWRTACGDPHTIVWGEPATEEVLHLNNTGCPGDVDLGPNEKFLSMVGRAFPRATPGRVLSLASDFETGEFSMTGRNGVQGQDLIVWSPTSAETHDISSEGIGQLTDVAVPGGRLLVAVVDDENYTLSINPRQ